MTRAVALTCSAVLVVGLPPGVSKTVDSVVRGILSTAARHKPEGVSGAVADVAASDVREEVFPNQIGAQRWLRDWCEGRGLRDEAARLTRVFRLERDPGAASREAESSGRPAFDERRTAGASDASVRREANLQWRRRFEGWKAELGDPDAAKRVAAAEALNAVQDRRALASVLRVFAIGGAGNQGWAVRILGHLDGPDAGRGLALLAVVGDSRRVRLAAMERLRHRDPGEFVNVLILLLREPLRYRIERAPGPIHAWTLLVNEQPFETWRLGETTARGCVPALGDKVGTDALGRPILYRFRGREPADSSSQGMWAPGWSPIALNGSRLEVDGPDGNRPKGRMENPIRHAEPMGEDLEGYPTRLTRLQAEVALLDLTNAAILERNAQLLAILGATIGAEPMRQDAVGDGSLARARTGEVQDQKRHGEASFLVARGGFAAP